MKYTVTVNFQGYVRGSYTHEVDAQSPEEAIKLCPNYINETTIELVRDDTEITDISIK